MNYRISFILIFLIILACQRNTQIIRHESLFDDGWKFSQINIENAEIPTFDDKLWRNIDLPHDWSIQGIPDLKNPTSNDGGYFPVGKGWYRKTFFVPESWKGKSISIYFEGVYMNSETFINGKSLGIHPYGYSSYKYDLTPYLDFGKDNLLSVKVDNSMQKNCRWYSGSGIYRHVWMVVTDPVHVAHWGVTITTPDVSTEKATVQIKTQIKNETNLPQSITLKTKLLGTKSEKTGEHQIKVELTANSEKEVTQTIYVSTPLLWIPQEPYLYQVQTQVLKDGNIIDDTKTNFGIRSIKFSTENGFQLNGKTVKLNGGCVHHDNGCLGAAAFDRAEERRVELLKAAGFKAIRTAHNPPSQAFLDACDRLGMLVIDESFDGWKVKKTDYDYAMYFDDWWQRDIEAMVRRDRNHPSIIMWSVGNEIIERKSPEAIETTVLQTSGDAAKIKLTPDRTKIFANGQDLSICYYRNYR